MDNKIDNNQAAVWGANYQLRAQATPATTKV